jgi:hypothetical protein
VLVLAQEKHWITATRIEAELKWRRDRINNVLELLVREGMAWIDDQHESGERAYWFPSLMGKELCIKFTVLLTFFVGGSLEEDKE